MNIQLNYAITGDDYAAFARAHMRYRRAMWPADARGWGSPFRLLWIIVIVWVVCVYAAPWNWLLPAPAVVATAPAAPLPPPDSGAMPLMALGIDLAMVFAPLIFVIAYVRSGYYLRRLGRRASRLNQPRTAEMTDAHFVIREDGSVTQSDWRYYIRFVEMPTVFVLFSTPMIGQIIPKRAFSSPELMSEFRRFAQAHVGNKPIGFPVQPEHTL